MHLHCILASRATVESSISDPYHMARFLVAAAPHLGDWLLAQSSLFMWAEVGRQGSSCGCFLTPWLQHLCRPHLKMWCVADAHGFTRLDIYYYYCYYYKPSRRSEAGLLVPDRPSVRPRKPHPWRDIAILACPPLPEPSIPARSRSALAARACRLILV